MNISKLALPAALLFTTFGTKAEIPDVILDLMEDCRLDEAKILLEEIYDEGDKSASLYLGRLAFMNYDFPEAARWYGVYRKEVKSGGDDTLKEYERQLQNAQKMTERVQRIVILDSISVPRDQLIATYRLPKSAGRFLSSSQVTDITGYNLRDMGPGFSNETGESVMWSLPDSLGYHRIVESIQLIDGSWSEPIWSSAILNGSEDAEGVVAHNAVWPFLLDDGLTLYYSSDNEGSIGGYDLFLATRDSATGDYFKPINMGMPFNSPFDDYMLAIDELNGVGWWATDRNMIPDKATIYVYELPEGRENVPEDEDMINAAKIANYRETWPEERLGDITRLHNVIRELDPNPFREPDFNLPVPGGRHYHFWSDFHKPKAAEAMKKYLETNSRLSEMENDLRLLRYDYSKGKRDEATIGKIRKLEEETEQLRATLSRQLSDVYKLEFVN